MGTFYVFDGENEKKTEENQPNMSRLESFDAAAMRKSRRNSFIMLSSMNLSNLEEVKSDDPSKLLLEDDSTEIHGHHHHHHHGVLRTNQKEAMAMSLSALYGKILVVIGMTFPVAEYFATDLPRVYYQSFYLYLYFGSIFFILFAYFFLLSSFTMPFHNFIYFCREIGVYVKPYASSASEKILSLYHQCVPKQEKSIVVHEPPETPESLQCSEATSSSNELEELEEGAEGNTSKYVFTESAGHGSMYLKMGTIIFGIGSMIYSGLEFGQYFELRSDCATILMAITPAARMVFTFLQMYFIFLNSRVSISRNTIVARFGIMHMVATNLCIWLNVLVEETKHTIHQVTHHDDYHPIVNDDHDLGGDSIFSIEDDSSLFHSDESLLPNYGLKLTEDLFGNSLKHNLVRRAASQASARCKVINLMGDMVDSAAPLLYPCTIEYSLLCASVLYVMWKNVKVENQESKQTNEETTLSHMIAKKVRHLYSVDCGRASRGLFTGIFILVLTMISLILFYVLISHPDFKKLGMLTANISEIIIYTVGIVTTIIGMKQMRELGFIEEEETELDNVLLVIAQGGVYIFTIFTLVGGYFSGSDTPWLPLLTAFVTLIQATLQTLYILDGSRRCCRTPEQLEKKSGREMVTFLLVVNLSMWLLSTFQTSRAQLHNAQQEFYGVWAWTIISHVSMPLGIFYRFHATVCLGEMWKRAYKFKP